MCICCRCGTLEGSSKLILERLAVVCQGKRQKGMHAIQMTIPGMLYRQDDRGCSSWEWVYMLAAEQRRRWEGMNQARKAVNSSRWSVAIKGFEVYFRRQ